MSGFSRGALAPASYEKFRALAAAGVSGSMVRIYPAAQKLVMAQRERGLEPRLAVRVGVRSREQPQLATKLAQLTGTNLRRARAILGGRQLILESVAPALAIAAAIQIERAGGLVEFELGLIERLAFAPEHPLRGMQPCERLMIRGGALVLTRGPLAGPGEAQILIPRGHVGELLAGFDRERARWAGAGLVEAVDEAELLARVGAREDRLEAELHTAKPAALPECAEIYGDWLQGCGDPRGLVATASLALARADADPTREQAARTLAQIVAEHGSHLLGSLVHELRPSALRWLGPMLFGARLAPDTVVAEREPGRVLAAAPSSTPEDAAELEQLAWLGELGLLERLLALPVSAHLRALELGEEFTRHPQVGAKLGAAACASSLKRLRLHGSVDLQLGGEGFTRLRRLNLSRAGGELRCALRVPALRRLELEFVDGETSLVDALADIDAPRLRELELRFAGAVPRGVLAQLEELLGRPSFAKLRGLGLQGRSTFEGIDRVLARVPAARTLTRVDVGVPAAPRREP